jgi:uncharacterized RmlC-like cupin family protein
MAEMLQPDKEKKFLLDPYGDWAAAEGVPIVEGLGMDLFEVETKPWARFDVDGALVHLYGRGDFTSLFLLDLPPGAKSSPQQHVFEVVIYVLSGHGSTVIETADGHKHTFEWGPKSLFALPLNCKYQHFNGSGTERARFAAVNYLPLMMNLFHNYEFIFDNPYRFPEREGGHNYFAGEGEFIPIKPGRNMWETNFVPDLSAFELKAWEARGAGSSNMKFILADGTMHAHSSEMPVGTYKKAHRHGADFYVFTVHGTGYTLLWYEGDEEFQRIDWRHGMVFVPTDGIFHQHFNTGPNPARYLAVALGSMRYPFVASKRALFGGGVDTSVEDGGNQIEYDNQDPRIHEIYLKELEKHGVDSGMAKYFDESQHRTKKSA